MTTRYDTNPATGLVLRHDVIAPFSPAHLPHGVDRNSPEWRSAYEAALRGEKADRATPAPKSKDAPDSITEIADNAFQKAWNRHNGGNQ